MHVVASSAVYSVETAKLLSGDKGSRENFNHLALSLYLCQSLFCFRPRAVAGKGNAQPLRSQVGSRVLFCNFLRYLYIYMHL